MSPFFLKHAADESGSLVVLGDVSEEGAHVFEALSYRFFGLSRLSFALGM